MTLSKTNPFYKKTLEMKEYNQNPYIEEEQTTHEWPKEQEMCASQNTPVYINYQMYNGNDPKINRVLPLPQGNHVAKFVKDPIYRTKVIVPKRTICASTQVSAQ
jgi:hypothetical protein